MNIYKKYAADLPGRDRAAAPADAAEGHVPGAGSGQPERGGDPRRGRPERGHTQPDVDVAQILSSLDSDTRNYLLLLLAGGAQVFHDRGASGEAPSPAAVADLRGTFKRFAPLNRDTQTFATLLAQRQTNIRRSIHNLQHRRRGAGGRRATSWRR